MSARAAPTQRKGELLKVAIDEGCPHQVAHVGRFYRGHDYRFIEMFKFDLRACSRGPSFGRDGVRFHVHCFAERPDAEKFLNRFGGDWLDFPKEGHGNGWRLLNEYPVGDVSCPAIPSYNVDEL